MTKNSRLRDARKKKGYTQKKLGELLGAMNEDKKPLTPQYITNLERGSGFSFEVAEKLAKILDTTPQWLQFGEYPVTDSNVDNNFRTNNFSNRNMQVLRGEKNYEHRGVPYYNLQMLTKIKEDFLDINEEPEYYIDAQPMNDCTAYIQIYGESMLPDYGPGMSVGVQRVENMNGIIYGSAYYIITRKSWNSIKKVFRVFANPMDKNSFVLRNSNPNFPGDLIIPKSGIASMHIVKGRFIIDNA